jgi:hypothetical protein
LSFLPQYLTNAILLGALHSKLPLSIVEVYFCGIKSAAVNMNYKILAKITFKFFRPISYIRKYKAALLNELILLMWFHFSFDYF